MIKESQITGRSGHAFSFGDDGSDATRISCDPHHQMRRPNAPLAHRAHPARRPYRDRCSYWAAPVQNRHYLPRGEGCVVVAGIAGQFV